MSVLFGALVLLKFSLKFLLGPLSLIGGLVGGSASALLFLCLCYILGVCQMKKSEVLMALLV